MLHYHLPWIGVNSTSASWPALARDAVAELEINVKNTLFIYVL